MTTSPASVPVLRRLLIERFRGIQQFCWYPKEGVNLILGGGDVGKTTILDGIALLLNPVNTASVSDAEYFGRDVDKGFTVTAVISLPSGTGINEQASPSWPWGWDGKELVIPSTDGDAATPSEPVYCMRVRGTEDLEVVYEIVQPDGRTVGFPVALRRAIGLVRLSGDDRNDRDLRLVQGSALDRLVSDKGLRARVTSDLADHAVKNQLKPKATDALDALNVTFQQRGLPHGLDLAVTGSQGLSVAALIGLTADKHGVPLPLSTWGAGTRRMSALTVAEQNQGNAPVMVIDEIERGLEPYRQHSLVERLEAGKSQSFVTTHSPFVIAAAQKATMWYVDHCGRIGILEASHIKRHREEDPETFLSFLTIVAEGATECGFVTALLEKALRSPLRRYGIHVSDAVGHESTLNLVEALARAGLRFGGFADDEDGKHPARWKKVKDDLGDLMFRWQSGCVEENILALLPDEKLHTFLVDPSGENTGFRLRTLAVRLGIEGKTFETIKVAAGAQLRQFIRDAAVGFVPDGREAEKKEYKAHAKNWFKTLDGGRELTAKMFAMGVWPQLKPQLLPFCNSVRVAVDLPEVEDLPV